MAKIRGSFGEPIVAKDSKGNEIELKFREPVYISYKPKEDITTYELALVIPVLLSAFTSNLFYEEDFEWDKSYMRHFEIVKNQ